MRAPRVRADVAIAAIALLALFGAIFLATVGIDALELRNDFQFFADSETYHDAARGDLPLETLGDIVGIAGNFLGPLIVLRLTGESYYAVLIVNAALLAFSVISLARSLRVDAPKLLFVLLLNPITVSSVLSVNKEILAVAFIALLVRFYAARSLTALVCAALVSVLVRWQMTLLLLVTLALLSPLNPVHRRRVTTLVVLLATLSILYVLLEETLAPIRLNFESAAADYEGSGLYSSSSTCRTRAGTGRSSRSRRRTCCSGWVSGSTVSSRRPIGTATSGNCCTRHRCSCSSWCCCGAVDSRRRTTSST
jgi:hypothetical protein